ncbi:MAG TPA: glycosyltransferase [Azospirillaceae bacterium]|nr:glycosyltransferase [Azospirillaceae bacterium]
MTGRNAPLITVIICTHNRAGYLRDAMASIIRQDFPRTDYELLVVDNASTDGTREVVESFRDQGPVRYVHEPRLGLCNARNTGWRAAAGRIAAYFDDDAIALPGWLAAVKEGFDRDRGAGVVGGRVDPIWKGERPAWLSDGIAASLTIVDWGPEVKRIEDLDREWVVGANMAIPVVLLEKVGGFHPKLDRVGNNMLSSGDVFLAKKIVEQGHACLYHPGMAIRHLVPPQRLVQDWFLRRYYWQGVSDAVMELIETRPGRLARLYRAAGRTRSLLGRGRQLGTLAKRTDDPDRFQNQCFTLIELGHIAGLLGAARI